MTLALFKCRWHKCRREYRGGATRENHNSTLLLSRVAAVGALAGGPCFFGWAHFAVAVVVLVIDAFHGKWLTIMIVLALRRG